MSFYVLTSNDIKKNRVWVWIKISTNLCRTLIHCNSTIYYNDMNTAQDNTQQIIIHKKIKKLNCANTGYAY